MTKAEIIRKIAKQSGVHDTEAKLFFEIFLRKAASIIEQGDALSVQDFGFFLPKKGKMNTSNFEGENLDVFLDLIVYKPSKDDKHNSLIFNVPESSSNGSESVDLYFSLSIGKPVIPLQGVKDIDFFLPPSGHELRRLIESKVEKLIEESEVIKNFKAGNDVILINKDEFDQSQLEMNYSTSNQDDEKYETDSDIDIEDSIDFNEVNWNSSSDLLKEIEEEALLDVGKDYDSVFEEETNGLSWNFGSTSDENYNYKNKGTEEQESELKSEEKNGDENSTISYDETNIEEKKNDENEIKDTVSKADDENNINDEISEEQKAEKEHDSDEYELKTREIPLSRENKINKERKSFTWIFILIALVLLAAAYFFISNMNKKQQAVNNTLNNNPVEKKTDDTVVKNISKNGEVNNDDKSVADDLSKFPKQNIEKISDYIFKYGKVYVVQVSSWKTKDKAVHQVDLYNSTGKKAFLEEVTIEGTLWYRVRVGDFNSLTEAKQFLNKN